MAIFGDGVDADGNPITLSNLGCGGVFEGCSDPNLFNEDNLLL